MAVTFDRPAGESDFEIVRYKECKLLLDDALAYGVVTKPEHRELLLKAMNRMRDELGLGPLPKDEPKPESQKENCVFVMRNNPDYKKTDIYYNGADWVHDLKMARRYLAEDAQWLLSRLVSRNKNRIEYFPPEILTLPDESPKDSETNCFLVKDSKVVGRGIGFLRAYPGPTDESIVEIRGTVESYNYAFLPGDILFVIGDGGYIGSVLLTETSYSINSDGGHCSHAKVVGTGEFHQLTELKGDDARKKEALRALNKIEQIAPSLIPVGSDVWREITNVWSSLQKIAGLPPSFIPIDDRGAEQC